MSIGLKFFLYFVLAILLIVLLVYLVAWLLPMIFSQLTSASIISAVTTFISNNAILCLCFVSLLAFGFMTPEERGEAAEMIGSVVGIAAGSLFSSFASSSGLSPLLWVALGLGAYYLYTTFVGRDNKEGTDPRLRDREVAVRNKGVPA